MGNKGSTWRMQGHSRHPHKDRMDPKKTLLKSLVVKAKDELGTQFSSAEWSKNELQLFDCTRRN